MRWRTILFFGLLAVLPASAEDWTTADGKTYKNVTIVEQQDGGVRITYSGGVGIIPYYELPLNVQKRLGVDFDSLEAKKKAAQQAADEAARNAAAAAAAADAAAAAETQAHPQAVPNGAMQPGAANQTSPATATQPGASTANAPASAATSSTSPASAAGSTTPSASNSSPSNPANATSANGAPAAANGIPAAGANGAPASATSPGSATATTSNTPGGSSILAPTTSLATGAPPEPQNPYSNSIYTYDESIDVCYLVSPTVSVSLVPSDPTKAPLASQGVLTLRIDSDGLKPTAPDHVEATFHGVGAAPSAAGTDHHIKFLVDGSYVHVEEVHNADDDGSGNISFYFSPTQAKSIFTGHNVNFSIAKSNYLVDESGITVFRKYLDTVDQLQPAPVSFSRMLRKFVSSLPPLTSIISTVCEYVFIGGAGLVVLIALMMLAIGTRAIIKW
jgi:hypothetical protein